MAADNGNDSEVTMVSPKPVRLYCQKYEKTNGTY